MAITRRGVLGGVLSLVGLSAFGSKSAAAQTTPSPTLQERLVEINPETVQGVQGLPQRLYTGIEGLSFQELSGQKIEEKDAFGRSLPRLVLELYFEPNHDPVTDEAIFVPYATARLQYSGVIIPEDPSSRVVRARLYVSGEDQIMLTPSSRFYAESPQSRNPKPFGTDRWRFDEPIERRLYSEGEVLNAKLQSHLVGQKQPEVFRLSAKVPRAIFPPDYLSDLFYLEDGMVNLEARIGFLPLEEWDGKADISLIPYFSSSPAKAVKPSNVTASDMDRLRNRYNNTTVINASMSIEDYRSLVSAARSAILSITTGGRTYEQLVVGLPPLERLPGCF